MAKRKKVQDVGPTISAGIVKVLHCPGEAEVKNIFSFHPATPTTGPKHDRIRAECLRLARFFVKNLPACPETGAAVARLREAMFYANAAVACRTEEAK